jgi:AMMECR1 domain-containing protein
LKNYDLEKLQILAAYSAIHKTTLAHFAKSTISAELDNEKQRQQSDFAQYITDSILVFTTLEGELGNLLTQRQRKLCLNSPIGF